MIMVRRYWCLAHVAVLDEVWPAQCCQLIKFRVQILEIFYTEVTLWQTNAVQLSQLSRLPLFIIYMWFIIRQFSPLVMKTKQTLKPNKQLVRQLKWFVIDSCQYCNYTQICNPIGICLDTLNCDYFIWSPMNKGSYHSKVK